MFESTKKAFIKFTVWNNSSKFKGLFTKDVLCIRLFDPPCFSFLFVLFEKKKQILCFNYCMVVYPKKCAAAHYSSSCNLWADRDFFKKNKVAWKFDEIGLKTSNGVPRKQITS